MEAASLCCERSSGANTIEIVALRSIRYERAAGRLLPSLEVPCDYCQLALQVGGTPEHNNSQNVN